MLKNDRSLFARLLIICQNRHIDLREILSYSLGTISFPLASVDGSLAKTSKSALLQLLEGRSQDSLVSSIPTGGAVLIDGMAIIQACKPIPATFGELADVILCHICNMARKYKCLRIDFITDTYPQISIKNPEREHDELSVEAKSLKFMARTKKSLCNG